MCAKTQHQSQVHVSGGNTEPLMDLAQIAEASSELSSKLEQVLQYVDDVLAEKRAPDNMARICFGEVH